MPHTAPVQDWATDFDVLDPRYVSDPFSIWDDLRQSCPIAHTERRKSSWLPTRYDDVTDIAHDIAHFSSVKVGVIPGDEDEDPNADFDGPMNPYAWEAYQSVAASVASAVLAGSNRGKFISCDPATGMATAIEPVRAPWP